MAFFFDGGRSDAAKMEVEKSNRFSYSRLSTYKECPRRYRYRYVDRIKRERKTAATFLGTCVHAALEEFYRQVHRGRTMTLEETLAVYSREWEAGWSASIKLHDERKPEDFRRIGERCLRDYYANHAPFDDGMAHEVEKRLSVTLPVDVDGEGIECVIEGILDRFSIPRREHDRVEIHDYKTNERLPTQAEFDEKFAWQFDVYDLLIRRHYPDVRRVEVVYHFLQSGQELRPSKDPSEDRTPKAVDWIAGLVRDIKRDHVWEPHQSVLCDWCEYRDICPLWAHGEKIMALPAREMSRDEGVKLVNRLADLEADRKDLKEQLEELEEREDEVRERLIEFAGSMPEAAGEKKVVISGTKGDAVVTEKEELRFPTKTHSPDQLAEFEGLLKGMALWREVSRVDPHLLLEGVKRKAWGPEVLAAVEALVQRFAHSVKERHLRFRRKKGEEEPG